MREKRKKHQVVKPVQSGPGEPMRLNRFIARAGVCSRREADSLIVSGKIIVNGKPATEMGMKVTPGNDVVEFEGKSLTAETLTYILLNKPKSMITTTSDERGRATVLDAIEEATLARVYPVGRLDRNTTGLLLLTNDGELTKKLTHPSHKVKKVYKATLDRDMDPEDMDTLMAGVELEDGPAKADSIGFVSEKERNVVGIEIHIGRNRIVRRMFEHLGYRVEALDRTMMGSLTKKNLPRGKWRVLTQKEISWLKML